MGLVQIHNNSLYHIFFSLSHLKYKLFYYFILKILYANNNLTCFKKM